VLGAAALAAALAACGSSSNNGGSVSNAANTISDPKLPTVTLMVGGIDKQIYLPYQLAQNLGFYKKYGVNVQLSTEQNGGVGAETAMASGQVDLAGAWYVHTIDFQQKGKSVVDVVNLSGAPGEREMCAKGTSITSPGQWAGKTVGVTDLGSGTDNLTVYLAARYHLTTKQFSRAAVGAADTFVAALEHNRIACGMTSQPTAGAVQTKGVGYTAFNLATTSGARQWLGGVYPAAGVLAQHAHRGADRRRDAAGVRQQRAHHEGGLHRGAHCRQGPVPARRHHAGRCAGDRSGHRQVRRQHLQAGEPGHHIHQPVRGSREQARGIHAVTAYPRPGAVSSTRRPRGTHRHPTPRDPSCKRQQ